MPRRRGKVRPGKGKTGKDKVIRSLDEEMRHLGRFVVAVIGGINLLFTALLLAAAYSPWVHPVAHPTLACMGLTFPIFLLIDLVFLAFWVIIRQYRCALLPLAGLLLCIPQTRTYLPLHFHTDTLPAGCIKVLSYNIMGFGAATPKGEENPILTYLRESDADIICLQEYATGRSRLHPSQDDVARALADWPYRRIDAIGKNQSNHIACYSKLPILSARPLRYASASNGSMAYELAWGTDTLLLINNHLESNKLNPEDKVVYEDLLRDPEKEKVKSGVRHLVGKLADAAAIRAPQADTIARTVARSPHRYILVCGDFNDSPISYAHRVIAEKLNDAFTESGCGPGISYNRNKFYFRIDNLLVSPDLKAYNCRVDRSIRHSDHYPIACHVAKAGKK